MPVEGFEPAHQDRRSLLCPEILAVLIDKHDVSPGYAGLKQTGFSVCSGQFPVPADGDGLDAVADPFGEASNGGGACSKPAGNRSVIVHAGVETGHFELPECLICQTDIAVP